MDYPSRLDQLQRLLPRLKCEALVISDLTNVRYLTGYTGTAGMVVALRGGAWFITDFRYQSQAQAQVGPSYEILIAERGLWKEAAKRLKKRVATVGFEAEHTSVATFEEVGKLIKPVRLVSTTRVVEKLRLVKDPTELSVIRRAVAVSDAAFEYICGVLRPGLTEREVAEELERDMRRRGATSPSFTTIVASGVRGSLPHGVASDKALEAGDMVTIDMGALVDGYCSDLTRTVCLGKPTREQQKVYETVWQAQTTAARAMRPGLGCKAADAIARKVIDDAGYGKEFGHGLGHGVGLAIHEQPRLSKIGTGKLQAGNIVTCEPGIYIEGWGGVRIEDMLVITDNGAQILSKAPKPRRMMAV